MAQLSEWLKLMVAEINLKREEEARAREEELARQKETSDKSDKKASKAEA